MSPLVKCHGCGAAVSAYAKACPQCGRRLHARVSGLVWVLALIVAFAIAAHYTYGFVLHGLLRCDVIEDAPASSVANQDG